MNQWVILWGTNDAHSLAKVLGPFDTQTDAEKWASEHRDFLLPWSHRIVPITSVAGV